MSKRRNITCNRLSSLGLKQHQVHQLVDQIDHWYSNNGHEWTISRLKDLKTLAIHRLARKNADLSSWIATHADGTPKGAFRPLWKGIDSGKHKVIAKAINACMSYTSELHGGRPTQAQWNKFRRAVEEPADSQSFSLKYRLPPIKLGKKVDIFHFPWSSERRAPGWFWKGTVPENEFEPQYHGFFQSWDSLKIIKKFSRIYDDVLDGNLYRRPYATHDPFENRGVGKISFIQEPGYKLRAIANPHRFHQLALEPLKEGLLDILKRMPKDCTHDQSKGVEWAQSRLKEGVTLHALDLSNATDAFPASLTFALLKAGQSEQVLELVDLFEDISKSPWVVNDPELGKKRLMTWKKGQPLGLGPSFPAFALTHHAVLCTLMDKHEGDYRILGDDIVIEGDSLAASYRETMSHLGVDISESKSISSNLVTEFAGKVILPSGVIPTVKWRDLSDRNFLDYTRFFGRQFIGCLRPRQKVVAKRIMEIPEVYGGLGFNPNGKPWESRVDEHWSDILRLMPQEQTLVSASDSTLSLQQAAEVGIIHPNEVIALGRTLAHGEVDNGVLPTGSSLARITSLTGITEGVFPVEDNPLTPSERGVGDPRGPSLLDIFEKKLGLGPVKKAKLNTKGQKRNGQPPNEDTPGFEP